VRIIVRDMGNNLPTNFAVSGTFRSRLVGQQLSDGPRDLVTMTFDFGGNGAVMRLYMLQLCTKFEVHRPSNSADITQFRSQH